MKGRVMPYNQFDLSSTERLTRALGWFSIALGAAESYKPGRSNNYPKPGDIAAPKDGDGSYPRVEAAP